MAELGARSKGFGPVLIRFTIRTLSAAASSNGMSTTDWKKSDIGARSSC